MAQPRDGGIGFDITCAASRHAELIADELIDLGSCSLTGEDAKYGGESIRSAVRSLYAARAEIKRLTAEVERHRLSAVEAEVLRTVRDIYASLDDDDDCAGIAGVIGDLAERLATR